MRVGSFKWSGALCFSFTYSNLFTEEGKATSPWKFWFMLFCVPKTKNCNMLLTVNTIKNPTNCGLFLNNACPFDKYMPYVLAKTRSIQDKTRSIQGQYKVCGTIEVLLVNCTNLHHHSRCRICYFQTALLATRYGWVEGRISRLSFDLWWLLFKIYLK